jgi:hypothetical protein
VFALREPKAFLAYFGAVEQRFFDPKRRRREFAGRKEL